MEMRRNWMLAALVMGAVAVGGCSSRDAGTGDTGFSMEVDSGTGAVVADTAPAFVPATPLSDANIVWLLDAASRSDSATGSIAATKGTNSEVRAYGARMARDHHDLRKQGQDLAKRLGITAVPPPRDAGQAQFDRTMAMLNGVARGRDFDKAYMDHEVAYHKTVLETATAAMNAAQNAELKNLIQKVVPVILGHLDLAQSIQGRLR